MIELVLTLCLASAPDVCWQEHLPFEGPIIGCAMSGQFQAADYLASHPKYTLKRWTCGPARRSA